MAPSRGNFLVASVESSYLVCPEEDDGHPAQACSVDPSTCMWEMPPAPAHLCHTATHPLSTGVTGDGDKVEMLGGHTSRHVGLLISVVISPPLAYIPLGLACFLFPE